MNKKHNYPISKTINVVDNFHGTAVSDPYRWLEDPDAQDTKDWVIAQKQFTEGYLEELPFRDVLHERLTTLWNYPRVTVPIKRGERYFYTTNEGLQNQNVLVRQQGLEGKPVTVIDPNTLSDDGTIALVNQSYSADGRYLAYGLSEHGSDWQHVRVRDVDSGEDLDDLLSHVKFTPLAWLPDNSGFYYARYPASEERLNAPPNTHHRVYLHQLGMPQAEDALIYHRPDEPDFGFSPQVTEDGHYLLLNVWQGTDIRSRIYVRDLREEGEFLHILDDYDAHYHFIANDGPLFYFYTNHNAPNGRVIAINLAAPEQEAWREIIPERADVLDHVLLVNDHFITVMLHDAAHRLQLFDKDGVLQREIALPSLGAITALTGKQAHREFFFDFHSFLWPLAVFRYDFTTGELSVFHEPPIDFDRDGYVTHREFLRSADGTRLPLFLTHKKDLPLDGSHPTLLYSYGGFAINMTPLFQSHRLAWLEQGGIYAHAVLRGGMEYGEEWYEAGKLANKQNVFDDFIAAAEYLIDRNYTAASHLAIEGRSNGGLLTAACLLQRPNLFAAVHSGVPVTDMLRFQRYTAGRYWTTDYGNAEENAEDFTYLIAYSPVHNARTDGAYPAVLITTADTDDRVVPMHAFKFAAVLQTTSDDANPILLRVETNAGHGLGKPVSKLIDEWADIYTFLWAFTNSH